MRAAVISELDGSPELGDRSEPAGEAIHDFLFAETGRTLHVCNAPSPAATSSLAIAELIADAAMPALKAS